MIEATSCGGVVIFRGKILLLYKNYKNKYEGWVLPKGTVEPGEEYQETADRNLLQMLKYRLYCFGNPPIPFPEFDKALTRIAALTEELRGFDEKDQAVRHMMQESGAGYEECSKAYDFYIRLFRIHEAEEEKQ